MLGNDRKYPVQKNALLHKLRENREGHLKDYNEAMEEYRKAVIDALGKEIEDRATIRAAARDLQPYEWKLEDREPTRPRSFLESYDLAIGLLEMTTETEVDINASDYRCYVDDEWHWKEEFRNTTMSYAGKGK